MNSLMLFCIIIIGLITFRGYKRCLYGVIYGVLTWALLLFTVALIAPGMSKSLSANPSLQASVLKKMATFYLAFPFRFIIDVNSRLKHQKLME